MICFTKNLSRWTNFVQKSASFSTSRALNIKLDISGIYPPIATPFDQNEEVDYKSLQENMEKWNKTNIKGYLVQGSNGEYCYLSMKERIEMVKKAREFASPDKIVFAGSGCESTRQTIELTKAMALDGGADAVVVVTPCYFKSRMNNRALIDHYKNVADQSPVPVILYSVPANTGLDIPVEVVVELSSHDNIVGMKDSGGDVTRIARMIYETQGKDFSILAGSAGFLLPALSVGAVGGICALANILPNEVCQILEKFKKREDAVPLQHRLIAPNTAVTKVFGVPGLKKAMDWFGYYGGPTRKPLMPLESNEENSLKKAFNANGFLL